MTDKTSTLSPDALDFAPGLLAIQESPPARMPRAVMYTVSSLFVVLLLWAMFGKLNIIASAEGRLVPKTYVKIVQPADAGIVREILVREGEQVRAGQVLMRMDTSLSDADARTIRNEMALRQLQLRRIDAELSGMPMMRRADDPAELFSQIELQYRERQKSYLDALEQAQAAYKKAQREHDSSREVLSKLKEVTPMLKQQADAYANMEKQGYAPRMMAMDKQRDYLEKTQDMRAQEATVSSLEAAISQAKKQTDQITSRYHSDLRNERVEADGQLRKLQQDWARQTHKAGLLELRASQAGIVKDLATHTIGTVVSPGTVLLSVVPENEPLVAEVMVKNTDVGFVYLQQKVKLKLAAYPFEKYGMLDGEVIHIGPDANDAAMQQGSGKSRDRSAQSQPSIYKAIVSLNAQTLETEGEKLKLVPGMQVVAEINQGSRTVMEYLLSPIQKTIYESGRER